MKMFRLLAITAPIALTGCYDFGVDPLLLSGQKFGGSSLFSELEAKGISLPGTKQLEQPGSPKSPLGEIDVESSIIQISPNEVVYTFERDGTWRLGLFALSDTHIFICSMMVDATAKNMVQPPADISAKLVAEPMNAHVDVAGPEEALFAYAKKIAETSFKVCFAAPIPTSK